MKCLLFDLKFSSIVIRPWVPVYIFPRVRAATPRHRGVTKNKRMLSRPPWSEVRVVVVFFVTVTPPLTRFFFFFFFSR